MGDMLVDELLAYIFCCGLSWRDLPRLALVCRYAGATRLSSPPPFFAPLPVFVVPVWVFSEFRCGVLGHDQVRWHNPDC
jgi:hypothetical protein